MCLLFLSQNRKLYKTSYAVECYDARDIANMMDNCIINIIVVIGENVGFSKLIYYVLNAS